MTEPTPIVPLEYFDRSKEPLLPMIRFLAIAGAVYAAMPALSHLWQLVSLFMPGVLATRITFAQFSPWLAEMPTTIAAIVMVVGGIMAARFDPLGRRILMVGAAAFVICSPFYSVWNAGRMISSFSPPNHTAFALYEIPMVAFGQVQRCLVPVLLWIFFGQSEVQEAMTRSR